MAACLIVGAGPGLGSALARRFGAGGFRLGLISRKAEGLNALVAELGSAGHEATGETADAGDPQALGAALEAIQARLGSAAVLIYNAALLRPGGPLELSPDRLAEEFGVNVQGALVAAQAVVPAMRDRGRGTILFTGGGLALEPYPAYASLALGKAALRSLAFSLHKELAADGIHVAVVAICGIVEPGGPFDPDRIAEHYWRLHAAPRGVEDRELIYQPPGSDPYYNDPERRYADVTRPPLHVKSGGVMSGGVMPGGQGTECP